MPAGNPVNVRVGPGRLYIAPLGTDEPTDLTADWHASWVAIGYTEEGSNFVFDNTFEDVVVAEELEPVRILQTARNININFQVAELTAANMQHAFNGGDVSTAGGVVTFTPPPAGEFTEAMIGWEADDGLERWVFRQVIQVGSVDIPRRRAPDKSHIPMSFRAMKPPEVESFVALFAEDYAEAS
jgi:hypothetical protein